MLFVAIVTLYRYASVTTVFTQFLKALKFLSVPSNSCL